MFSLDRWDFFPINQLISFVFKSICFLFLAMCSFQFNLQSKCSPRYFTISVRGMIVWLILTAGQWPSSVGMTCWTTQCDIPEDLNFPCLHDMVKLVFKAVTIPTFNTQWYFCWSVTARRSCHQPRPATLKQPRNFGSWVQSWLGWGTGTPSLLLTSYHRPARLHTLCGWRPYVLWIFTTCGELWVWLL
jgi:hypothetical protein